MEKTFQEGKIPQPLREDKLPILPEGGEKNFWVRDRQVASISATLIRGFLLFDDEPR